MSKSTRSLKNTEPCEHGCPVGLICGKCHPRSATVRKDPECSRCGIRLSSLQTWSDRAEHSADCYGREIKIPRWLGG